MEFTGIIRNLSTGESQVFDNIDKYNSVAAELIECGVAFTATTSSLYEPASEECEGCEDCEKYEASHELTREDIDLIKDFAQSYKEFTKLIGL